MINHDNCFEPVRELEPARRPHTDLFRRVRDTWFTFPTIIMSPFSLHPNPGDLIVPHETAYRYPQLRKIRDDYLNRECRWSLIVSCAVTTRDEGGGGVYAARAGMV